MEKLFEAYIRTGFGHVKFARGAPAVSGREFHDYDEIVLFLEGDAELISSRIQMKLEPGMIIMIPKEQFHQFCVNTPQEYLRCILGFSADGALGQLVRDTMRQVVVLPRAAGNMREIFDMLMQASWVRQTEPEAELLLRSAVVQLLMSWKLYTQSPIEESVQISRITQQALAYIDANLAGQLRLEEIAGVCNVSVSSLSHRFSKELKIPVYRYITEKRLSSVRQLTEKGVPLSEAAQRSGFSDYAGFYRLYRKKYGQKPSSEQKKS